MKILYFLVACCCCLSANAQLTIIDSLPQGAYGCAAWGDFDGDDLKDIAFVTQAIPDVFTVYRNQGDHFEPMPQVFGPMFNAAIACTDLDGDGLDDIIVSGMDETLENKAYIFRSRGDGYFDTLPNNLTALNAGAIDLGDYNQDGLTDIAMTGFESGGAKLSLIFKNKGDLEFEDIQAGLEGIHFGELKWGDYDLDGQLDLVINGLTDGEKRLLIYHNLGNDQFELQPQYFNNSGGTVDWIDYDLDGYPDILLTGYDDTTSLSFTALLHNDGKGGFEEVVHNLPTFGEPSAVTIADFNLDGISDICFLGGSDLFSFSALCYGQGSPNFALSIPFSLDYINCVTEATDMDGDGDPDLLLNFLVIRNDNTHSAVGDSPVLRNISISPNPASGLIRIEKLDGRPYRMLRADGQLVCDWTPAGDEAEADLGPYPSGLYFVQVLNPGKGISSTKVIRY